MGGQSLSLGKIDPATLKQVIFSHLGSEDSRVRLGPSIGEDAAVINFGNKALVVHSDPITGAIENIGWHAVNVCANDIATRGVRPQWMLIVFLLPENITLNQLKGITAQVDEAAKELGVAVVGGHSEVTATVAHPVLITTAIGETAKGRFIRTSGARAGDALIITKGAAIEGTSILAHEFEAILKSKVDKKTIEKARRFIKKISVVKDALAAVEVGGVHAMHDATEGGIAGGLQEIAWASKRGLIAYEDKMIVAPETRTICESLGLDPLKTISSGTLIIACESKKAEEIVERLRREGIPASIVGEILPRDQGVQIARRNGSKLDLSKQPVKEELWRVFKKS
jgi:hydrogenase expression/formation protein HypE